MKRFTPFILLLVMSCEVVSCESPLQPKKDPPPIVAAGRVVDRVTGEPLSGATMSVLSHHSTGLFGRSYEKEFGARPVAQDGSFEFQLPGGRSYTIRAFSKEQIAYGLDNPQRAFVDDRQRVGLSGSQNMELRLSPTAWLVITPRTDRPLGPNDEFALTVNDWPAGVRNQPAPYSRLVASKTVRIAWHVRRDGITDDGAIDLPIERHTVMDYTLEY